jgi:hypothetical protein
VPKGIRTKEKIMKKSTGTHGFTRAIRVGLGGALLAGFSVIGAGVAVGTAGASASSTPVGIVHVITVPVHCRECLNPQPLPP